MSDEKILRKMSNKEFWEVLHDIEPGLCDQQIGCHSCIMINRAKKYGLRGGAWTCMEISKEADRRDFAFQEWMGVRNKKYLKRPPS